MKTIRKSLFLILMLFVFVLGASISVFASGYDFTYESVYKGKSYDKNGHQLSIDELTISGKRTHRIFVSTNYVYSRFRISGGYGVMNSVFTNGKNFIYVLNGATSDQPKEIRCYSWETSSSREIARTKISSLVACNGKYLFYTVKSKDGSLPLYRLTLSSGKTKKIIPDANVVKYGNGKYLAWRKTGASRLNSQLYVMKKDGTGVKKISKVMSAAFYKKKIYYKRFISKKGRDIYVKIYSCNLTGKNKKALTKKIKLNKVPARYLKMGL